MRDESKQRAIKFLEKENKTYLALARFFSRIGIKKDVRLGKQTVSLRPSFYKERMKEAKTIVAELKKAR